MPTTPRSISNETAAFCSSIHTCMNIMRALEHHISLRKQLALCWEACFLTSFNFVSKHAMILLVHACAVCHSRRLHHSKLGRVEKGLRNICEHRIESSSLMFDLFIRYTTHRPQLAGTVGCVDKGARCEWPFWLKCWLRLAEISHRRGLHAVLC